jgi:hypothetical protein
MSLVVVGGVPWSSAQRGVELVEAGINVRRFQVRYFPQINERLPDNFGENIARAQSNKFSREVTVEGEVVGTTGIMAFTLGAACTVANDIADYGGAGTVGSLLMDEGTVTQERAGWRSVSTRLSSDPSLVIA